MKMSRCFRSPLVAFLFTFTLLSQAGVAAAKSGKGQDPVNKVVEINKQALAQIKEGKFDVARDALWGAIAILTDANMGEHEIAARTHVHLAAVYMTGFNDRTKAIRQFVMALKINPDIKITPQVETAALDEAFDAAHGQAGQGAQPTTAAAPAGKAPAASAAEESTPATPAGPSTGGRRGLRGKKLVDQEEPSPPSRVPEPFYCPLPSEVPPKEDIMVRCVTQKQPRRATATIFYRETGSDNFTALPMIRDAKGWLSATVPAAAVTGNAFSYYLEAKIPGVKDLLTIGTADSPNLMPIIDGATPVNNTALAMLMQGKDTSLKAAPVADDSAPLADINKQFQIDEDLRKYHRRLAGAFFLGAGGGAFATTYHGAMSLDSGDPGSALQKGVSPASLFQIVSEFGYQFTDKLAASLQVRYQYTPSLSAGGALSNAKRNPPTSALAFFLRGQYSFLTAGNFQVFGSGILGYGPGRVFMGYVARNCDPTAYGVVKCDASLHQIGHSDTASSGPVAVGVGLGMMYHLTRFLALWVEARGLSSFGPTMLLAEYNAGFAIAHKFETSAAPPPMLEGGGAWEKPEDSEKPPTDDSPSD